MYTYILLWIYVKALYFTHRNKAEYLDKMLDKFIEDYLIKPESRWREITH